MSYWPALLGCAVLCVCVGLIVYGDSRWRGKRWWRG